jgi:hypothetical protein
VPASTIADDSADFREGDRLKNALAFDFQHGREGLKQRFEFLVQRHAL